MNSQIMFKLLLTEMGFGCKLYHWIIKIKKYDKIIKLIYDLNEFILHSYKLIFHLTIIRK